MQRIFLTALVLGLASGGLALAAGSQTSPFSLKPVVERGIVGPKGAPASLVKRQQAPAPPTGVTSAYSFGKQGAPASMVRGRNRTTGYTNVIPAGAGEAPTLVGRPRSSRGTDRATAALPLGPAPPGQSPARPPPGGSKTSPARGSRSPLRARSCAAGVA